MIPFLKSIARVYAGSCPDLSKTCFVFPNKRSGTFFLQYLKEEAADAPILAPVVTTVSDFVLDIAGREKGDRIEMLFMLYEEYCRLQTKPVVFDRFRPWGEVAISDFSDVDMYGVDAQELFQNLSNFREIRTNYLSEDQRRVMEHYFGEQDFGGHTDTFWRHFRAGENVRRSSSKHRFLQLWETLAPLYAAFRKRLDAEGICYDGLSYRLAYERVAEQGNGCIPYDRVVFVGFNILPSMQFKLFEELQKTGIADFYWDCTGPMLADASNPATYFIHRNRAALHSRFDISASDAQTYPEVMRVVGCPSNVAQAKVAADIVGSIVSEDPKAVEGDMPRTAVVLPDESLLLPMLFSVPENVSTVNLTMGYPIRMTATASFMTIVRRLFANTTIRHGVDVCFHENVSALLSHPFMNVFASSDEVKTVVDVMNEERLYQLPVSRLCELLPGAAFLFDFPPKGETGTEASQYMLRLLDGMEQGLMRASANSEFKPELELHNVAAYREAIVNITDTMSRFDVHPKSLTFMMMAERLAGGEKVNFEGKPLKGLQIIGTLETRCLDFENIIIPSLNERIFPRRLRQKTFIPNTLRRGYGMPTTHFRESVFAYYFYRMLSRAKRVYMLYDARTAGLRSGDVSRYLLQLKHLFRDSGMKWDSRSFQLCKNTIHPISVSKTGRVRELLEQYLVKDSNSNLSASSLWRYVECPLRFFLECVAKMDVPPQPSEFMDSITIGDVFHGVMQDIYTSEDESGHLLQPGKLITPEFVRHYMDDRQLLTRMVSRRVRRHYYNDTSNTKPLEPDVEMFTNLILRVVLKALRQDLELAKSGKLIYRGSEVKDLIQLRLDDVRRVNMKYIIDRVDQPDADNDDRLRLIDYKTGSEMYHIDTAEDILDGSKGYKVVFQLMLYANLLVETTGYDKGLRLGVYDMLNLGSDKADVGVITVGGVPVSDHLELNEVFRPGLDSLLNELFDYSKPFMQTEHEKHCTFCPYAALCSRDIS